MSNEFSGILWSQQASIYIHAIVYLIIPFQDVLTQREILVISFVEFYSNVRI